MGLFPEDIDTVILVRLAPRLLIEQASAVGSRRAELE